MSLCKHLALTDLWQDPVENNTDDDEEDDDSNELVKFRALLEAVDRRWSAVIYLCQKSIDPHRKNRPTGIKTDEGMCMYIYIYV